MDENTDKGKIKLCETSRKETKRKKGEKKKCLNNRMGEAWRDGGGDEMR